jgi:DNA adenine methylase
MIQSQNKWAEGQKLSHQLRTRGKSENTPADRPTLKAASVPCGRELAKASRIHMSKKTEATVSKPVAPYIGGKRNLAKRLCAIIDAHDHITYAEPFVGMGGIFLRRKRKPRSEFINDYSQDVYNLFRILQEHYVAFLDLLRFQITTQAGFERLMKVDPETLTDLQRAARFLYVQRVAFGGIVNRRTFGIATERPARFNLTTLETDLEALHERLSGVTVMCQGYEAFIKRVDRPTTLFYLDPPYFGSESDYGKDAFSRDDFANLADILKAIKGQFILSINDVPDIRALFDWAEIVPVRVTYTLAGGDKSKSAGELLISNFPLEPHGVPR